MFQICYTMFTIRACYGTCNFNTSISQFTTTQLAQLWYHYLHISKQSSSIKLLIVFNALFMKVFIIPTLDANHIRTNFIAKANYHAIPKDSQNNISEAWEINNLYKIKPLPCSKKWSTRAKLSSSKDISEAHRVF